MAESEPAADRLPPTGLMGFVRSHLAFVLTLIPILLTAMRVGAVANGDRAMTLLSTIDVTSVLLGTFAWLLPSAFACILAGERPAQPALLPHRHLLFRKPARRGAGKAVIVGVAFLTIFLAPLVFRSATCGSRRNGSPSRTSPSLSATCSRLTRSMPP